MRLTACLLLLAGYTHAQDVNYWSSSYGPGLDLKSSGGNVIPQIVSNTITLKMKKPFTIAYALVHEPIMSFTGTQRKDARQNVLNDSYSPGAETFVGQYTARKPARRSLT